MILDILSGYKSEFAFTADNAVASKTVAAAGIVGATKQFYPSGQVNKFKARDNFVIVSAMLAVSHGYKWGGETPPGFLLNVEVPTGALRPLTEIGNAGFTYFPDFNQWVDFNIPIKFADYWTDTDQWIRLQFDLISGTVSQAGMPAVLNTAVVRVVPILKVIHTITLGNYA